MPESRWKRKGRRMQERNNSADQLPKVNNIGSRVRNQGAYFHESFNLIVFETAITKAA
jgi:hypothetical protein